MSWHRGRAQWGQYTENKRPSKWQHCRHRRHRELSFRQLTVPPVTTMLSIWRPFVFNVMILRACHPGSHIWDYYPAFLYSSQVTSHWNSRRSGTKELQRLASLRWRHNERVGVSNHRRLHCLLKRSFTHRSKKTSKLRVTGLCEENSPWPVNSPHKGPVTRKMFPFDDVIVVRIPG